CLFVAIVLTEDILQAPGATQVIKSSPSSPSTISTRHCPGLRISQPVDGDPALRLEGVGFAGDNHGHRRPHALSATRPLGQGSPDRPEASPKPKDVGTIRVRLQLEGPNRDLAMFNLAFYSKLRGFKLFRLKEEGFVGTGIGGLDCPLA